jgi:transposase InsO family protein
MRRRGSTLSALAERLGVPRTTLASWTESWSETRSKVTARGRPAERPEPAVRREVIETLRSEGTGVGIPELGRRFPGAARRELEELRARYASCLRRRGPREALYRLEWTRPGAVWASDFTHVPFPIDGAFPKVTLVRDLASHEQLLAEPATGESAGEVRLALESLFLEHGPPLVLKLDNGPGYVAEATRELCARHGVLVLPSPPYTPSYNGACEAGVGSIKSRCRRIADAAGRPARWTRDDLERAREQCNHCVPVGTATPHELWSARTRIHAAERARFREVRAAREAAERERRGFDQLAPLKRADQAMIDRAAIVAALIDRDLLKLRRA